MSYILEALRKMEKQRKQDSIEGSWVESLTAELEGEKKETHRAMRWLVAASVFFGLAGIITGFVLYHDSRIPEKGPVPLVQETKADPKPERPQATTEQALGVPASPAGNQQTQAMEKSPAALTRPNVGLQALTLSEVRAARLAGEEAQDSKRPKGLTIPRDEGREIQSPREMEEVAPKRVPPAPESPQPQDNVTDLTGRYRLSSTGEMNQKKYATLDRNDYSIGDEFMGMVITDIQRDRVHLKGKADGRRYVIRFGYR